MDDLKAKILAYLERCRPEGAMWTADIAQAVKAPTGQVRRRLFGLVDEGKVKRVVDGNPSSWAVI